MQECVSTEGTKRPDFTHILARLKSLLAQIPKPEGEEGNHKGNVHRPEDEDGIRKVVAAPSSPETGFNFPKGKEYWETKTRSEIITDIVDHEKQFLQEKEKMEKSVREQLEKEFAVKMEIERAQLQERMRRDLEEARERLQNERTRSVVSPAAQPTKTEPSTPNSISSASPTQGNTQNGPAQPEKERMDRKIQKLQRKIKRLDHDHGNEASKEDAMRRLEEQILSLYDSAARVDAIRET